MTTPAKAKRTIRNDGQFADRIRTLRLAAGLTQPQLAMKLGVTKNAVTNWEAGTSRPDISTLAGLCDALNVSADELLGRGSSTLSVLEAQLVRRFRELTSYDQRTIVHMMDMLDNARMQERRDRCQHTYRPLPMMPYAMGAGLGEPLGESRDAGRLFVRNTKNSAKADHIVRVNGDSMMPTFQDGELLLVESTDSINEGEIGIFIVAGEGFVKEYHRDGLHSHNPHYNTFMPADDEDTRCIGRVLGTIGEAMLPSTDEERILQEIYA